MSSNIGYFIGGVLLGGILGGTGAWFATKKRYEKVLDAKVQEMSNEIAKIDPFAPKVKMEEKAVKKVEVNKAEVKTDIITPVSTDDVKKFKEESKSKVNYSAAYENSEVETKATSIFDLMKDVEEVDDDEIDEDDPTIDFHSRADLHSDPFVISADAAGDIPDNYESETLFYYVPNDVLVDEYDEEIDEPGKCVGNLLTESGFKDKDNLSRHLYIQNPRLNVIYDIQKVLKPWEGKEGGV